MQQVHDKRSPSSLSSAAKINPWRIPINFDLPQ